MVRIRTNYHDIEVESLSDTLAVPLVREVSKADIAGQLPSNDVLAVIDDRARRRGGSGGCGFEVRTRRRRRLRRGLLAIGRRKRRYRTVCSYSRLA